MPNKTYAVEWITFAYKNLATARLLYDASHIDLDDNELMYLKIATNYYKEDRYPNHNYELPTRDEIHEVLQFAEKLFVKVCDLLNIEMKDIVNV